MLLCTTYAVSIQTAQAVQKAGGTIIQANQVFMDFYLPTPARLPFAFAILN